MDQLIYLAYTEVLLSWRRFTKLPYKLSQILIYVGLGIYIFSRWMSILTSARHKMLIGDVGTVDGIILGIYFTWLAWLTYSEEPTLSQYVLQIPIRQTSLLILYIVNAIMSPYSMVLFVFTMSGFWALYGHQMSPGSLVARIALFMACCVLTGIAFSRLLKGLHHRRGHFRFCTGAKLTGVAIFIMCWVGSPLAPQIAFRTLNLLGLTALLGAISCLMCAVILVDLKWVPGSRGAGGYGFLALISSRWVPFPDPELFVKDLRVLFAGLEPWLASSVMAYGAWQIFWMDRPVFIQVATLTLIGLFLFAPASVASFGLEVRQSLIRYILLHPSWECLIKSKNKAFFVGVGLIVPLPLLIVLVKVGVLAFMTLVLIIAMTSMCYAAWGNELTLVCDGKRLPYRYVNLEIDGRTPVNICLYIACSMPAGCVIMVWQNKKEVISFVLACILAFAAHRLYCYCIKSQGKRLEEWLLKKISE